ncbi:polymorphic toxin-type HINT domain-containing protein [Streptosporangium sp. NBC_01495]|uniref:polymorphic toxin-type HINT domain-containing protein n=1 Tax=Streptosporangium sp. NBC_01495 TaxID=2903899 RepID=UPI002E3638B8|nr:polymorphic toxin-type HINT domain-containing protein [Streptosporangium sp. NBC_01495]
MPKPKAAKGAEDSAPVVKPKPPVWPKAGSAEVEVKSTLARAGELPVRVGAVDSGAEVGTVKVETLPAETVRTLGGVGVAARFGRADGGDQPGKVRAEFSYANFRDGFGGNFAGRLQILRLPACAVQTPRSRECVVRPQVVKTSNDLKSGVLIAEVEIGQTAPAKTPAAPKGDAKAAAKAVAEATAARQLAEGSVYLMAAGLTGPDGNFGATDLKPSGTWQAGTSGGGFSYDYPLPEAPSPIGNGPELSLGYDASSVDGQGNWTNNQSSAVGAGWELNTGFIERKYRRCVVDNYYNEQADLIWEAIETGTFGKALCWESPDANDNDATTTDMTQSELVLNVGGRSAQIVKDRTSGLWKTVPDFGWQIEQLPGGADSQAYWKVTSSEGQVSRFGFRKDAQWQVPYIGNESGEPCFDRYLADAIPPTCTGVWRWNLDQSIDANENVIDYTYNREINYFCLPSCFHEIYRVLPYDRGGFLAKAEWGHNTQVASSVPTSRTIFTTADRGTTDVPTDLKCDVQVGCANGAIAFYSTRKLDSVLTESLNPATSGWDPVTRLNLTYTWVYTRTDFGAPYDPVLWLDTIQQTGLAGGSITLPPTDFDATMLAGKMVYDDISDWTDLLSWRMVPRIATIANGMGGRIEVAYGQADPCSGGKGRDGTNYFNDHTGDCYKIDMSEGGNEAWTLYYKQLVTKVTEKDTVAASPDMVNSYEYLGGPGWASPVEYAQPGLVPPSTDWRGYATVRTTRGSGSDAADFTVTSDTFLRGMGTSVTTFEGTTVTDVKALQGQVLQEQSWKLTSLSPRTFAEVESTRYEYTVQSTGSGPGVQDPAFVLRTRERGREQVTGGAWRWTESRTAYNADGLPNKVNDYGDTAIATDNTCTTSTYARNVASGAWMTSFPSSTERRSGDDCATGALIGKTVTLYDGGTDPATNTPSDGNVTETRTYANATTVSTAKATFDEYGRPLTSIDPLNKTTTTTYVPAVGWPNTGVTVTNPLGHTVTTRSSHLSGLPISLNDANNKRFEIDYDALGRTSTLWGPGEPRSGGTPTATVAYNLSATAPARTTTRRLLTGTGANAKYTTTYTYEDGLGRTRENQTDSPAGGRIVTVATYDSRGLTLAQSRPVHNTMAPGSGLLNPTLTNLPQWTKTVYDGLERPTAVIDYNLAAELRRTTTAYPGADRIEVTPPVGGKTATVSDAAGRTVKTEEWKDAIVHHDTSYGYDLAGNLTKISDANGNVRTFTYDWLSRRTTVTDPDSGSSSSRYDAAGRLLWSIDGNNAKISYGYDDLGRRTSQWAGETGTGIKLAEWIYDTLAKGQTTSATRYVNGNAYIDTVTGYDNSYRPTGTKLTIPGVEGGLAGEYAFTALYDKAGNLLEQGMPGKGGLAAEKLTLSYTDLGFAKGLTSDYSGGTTYIKDTLYTATGRPSERIYGANGQVKRSFTWDTATGWLSRLTTTAKADTATPQIAQDDQVTYNAAGEITRILDAASAIPGTTPGQSECFTYDGLSRLSAAFTTTAASCATGPASGGVDPYNQSYAYDGVGNLTSLTDGATTATYTYPAPGASAVRPNAVTSIARAGGTVGTDTYGYDNAGQLTARTVGGKQGTFTWNPLGQLDKAVIDGAETSMVYDADGERLIRREPDGTATLYLGAMELELSGGTVKATRYYTGPDGSTVALRTGAGIKWLASGLHGSTQLAVDDATGQVARERYLPYGKRRGSDDLPFTDRGFLGKIEDDSTGLNYLSARYYDPSIAKFVSTDPLLNLDKPQWLNAYGYAGNNPIGMSDPTGLRPAPDSGKADPCYKPKSRACKQYRKYQAETEAKTAQAEVDRQLKLLLDALTGLAKIAADELGITAGIKCFTTGNLGACGETALNILGSLAGGLAGKLAAKYSLPWKWKKAYEIGQKVWKHAGDAINAFKGWLRSREKLQAAANKVQEATQALIKCTSSFVPGTKVLMADGTQKPIEKVAVGDKVLATDPKTGKSEAKPVIALISSQGAKNLVQITVDTDGEKGSATGVVIATDQHPFWVNDLRAWVKATRLQPGAWLQTSAGTHVQVTAIKKWTTQKQPVHNLTVANIHTYHVVAGASSLLVHNCRGKIGYGVGDLSQAVQQERLKDKNKGNNYGAAMLEDGTIIVARSGKRIHAEEALIKLANGRKIVDLYTEREPCANKCQGLTKGMNVSWSWDWNNVDRDATNKALKRAVNALFS